MQVDCDASCGAGTSVDGNCTTQDPTSTAECKICATQTLITLKTATSPPENNSADQAAIFGTCVDACPSGFVGLPPLDGDIATVASTTVPQACQACGTGYLTCTSTLGTANVAARVITAASASNCDIDGGYEFANSACSVATECHTDCQVDASAGCGTLTPKGRKDNCKKCSEATNVALLAATQGEWAAATGTCVVCGSGYVKEATTGTKDAPTKCKACPSNADSCVGVFTGFTDLSTVSTQAECKTGFTYSGVSCVGCHADCGNTDGTKYAGDGNNVCTVNNDSTKCQQCSAHTFIQMSGTDGTTLPVQTALTGTCVAACTNGIASELSTGTKTNIKPALCQLCQYATTCIANSTNWGTTVAANTTCTGNAELVVDKCVHPEQCHESCGLTAIATTGCSVKADVSKCVTCATGKYIKFTMLATATVLPTQAQLIGTCMDTCGDNYVSFKPTDGITNPTTAQPHVCLQCPTGFINCEQDNSAATYTLKGSGVKVCMDTYKFVVSTAGVKSCVLETTPIINNAATTTTTATATTTTCATKGSLILLSVLLVVLGVIAA